jgi:hypothetical protein
LASPGGKAELIAMARAELKADLDAPEGLSIAVVRDAASWEFRASGGARTVAKPGDPEGGATLVQIGDHLSEQYDLQG